MDSLSRRSFIAKASAAAASLAASKFIHAGQTEFDLVILNARCIDPDTRLDAVRNVGVSRGRIASISHSELRGKRVIDGNGLVLAPGFIDIIAHGQDLENDRLSAFDGVTTKLQMENGVDDQDAWHREQQGKRMLNYGAGCGHNHARNRIFGSAEAADKGVATDAQVAEMANILEEELRKGAIGVGFGLEYTPLARRWEVMELFKVAGKYRASCHVHTRYGTLLEEQSNLTAIQEVIASGLIYGAPVHIVHVPSMGLSNTDKALRVIEAAQKRGLDVSCDFYPYTAFGTGISSEVFDPGWQTKFGIDYKDLEWAATHERLTAETFEKYRKAGGFVIAHAIPEAAVREAVKSPATMVGSDGRIYDGVGHPRTTGTFARVLGHYSRDEKLITLMEALKKMTIMPAKRLEKRCSAFRNKGRLQVGCDADLVLFDSRSIIDRATFDKPAELSEGVKFLWVHGQGVIEEGKLVEDARPGKGLRA
jgi:N-acyl-D-aspartate/D-glutamate deacylase